MIVKTKKDMNYVRIWFTDEYKRSIEALYRPLKDTALLKDKQEMPLLTRWENAMKSYKEEKQFWQTIKNTNNGGI